MSSPKRVRLDGDAADAPPFLVTHSGTHHADEALAVSLLRALPRFADMPLVRTRDAARIAAAHCVVDVGAEYDAARQRFDHHQRGFEETFDAAHKTKLSSAGLVWKHFGTQILAAKLSLDDASPLLPLLHTKLYDDFVEAIDGIDNGQAQYPGATAAYKSSTDLSARVGRLNPRWNEELPADAAARAADSDRRFEKAAALAGGEFWERLDYTVQAWLPAREIVERALAVRKEKSGEPSGRVLVFDEYASWKDHVYALEKDLSIPEAEQIIYVVYPDEAGSYRVQAVPEHADSFNSRRALPEQWRGVRDEQLSEKSGIPGCVFVHASGFIGGNKTRDGALQMARKALDL
ncbi:metal-dependent protein hydrolase [Tilletiopsis washingtonensis]|uniref:Metal-dependent protein hydrolase n=1 Tax=Tilletiopsis washingtonensis TaxID=58919 RepID=A0A316Z3A0_9BASI|nr:metal-dependent protein hydrolase [Tilletiopsis washingtonensis]PWN95382.1 metal-dependent protein hydrolase [Tilletiopsis washingtonensis]